MHAIQLVYGLLRSAPEGQGAEKVAARLEREQQSLHELIEDGVDEDDIAQTSVRVVVLKCTLKALQHPTTTRRAWGGA